MKGADRLGGGEPDVAGRLSGLNDVSIRITESLDLDIVLQEVMDSAHRVGFRLPLQRCSVDHEGQG